MKNIGYCSTPIGDIAIVEEDGAISQVFFCADPTVLGQIAETDLIKKAAEQLDEYFKGRRKAFDLPLAPQGTPFQQSVWNALLKIKFGETRSYKEIAEQIGNPKAVRAVGMANNRNPISIIIPCHRVIGSDGSIVGYGGGLSIKQYLLELERCYD